jgi:hypothetical protein
MKVYCILVLLMCIIVTSFACSNGRSEDNDTTSDLTDYLVHPDTLDKWATWAMRTDDGLWEYNPEHSVNLELVSTYGGEDLLNPPFYKVNWMHITGDTLFVSDQAQETLVCMGLDGSFYWSYGEEGEGPGHFCYIGGIDTGSGWVAVCNTYGDRVEILNRSGERISLITVSNPQDVIALSDSTIAVLSKAEHGGNVQVYQLPDSLLYSFGRPEWTHSGIRANSDLAGMLVGDTLIVTSRFCNQIFFFYLEDRTVSDNFAREYPTEYETTRGGVAWSVMGQPFLGIDSTICVELSSFSADAEFKVTNIPFEEWAPVTIIDRYDYTGNYLDSFCIPVRGGSHCIYTDDDELFVRQYSTSTIYRFKVI